MTSVLPRFEKDRSSLMTDDEEKAFFLAEKWATFLLPIFYIGVFSSGFIGGSFFWSLFASWVFYNTISAIDPITAVEARSVKAVKFTLAGPIIGGGIYGLGIVAEGFWSWFIGGNWELLWAVLGSAF